MKTNKMIYFRAYNRECELFTKEQADQMERLFGKDRHYNHLITLEEDRNYGTGIHFVTDILATIQCNRILSEREEALRNRIKKGLTVSKSYNGGYVETNLLWNLVGDAITEFKKNGGNLRESMGLDDKPEIYIVSEHGYAFKEFMRLFNIPFESVTKTWNEKEKEIKDIPKPVKMYKVKGLSEKEYVNDVNSTYQCHTIKGKLAYHYNKFKGSVYEKHPYLGKLHQSMFGEDSVQLYVYDYADRRWAAQNVIHYLVTKGYLELT